ncbi:MAG: acyl carrier protein [Legionellales bacterium]|nr:acyl carrier protein [Legionellales bacterium]|tara:strand:- start:149 stop:397 length:249 start_codon:yes stop_codon:yes gene_type:complete
MSETVYERVKKVVVEHLGVDPDQVSESSSFMGDLGADSLDQVELLLAFEEEFDCVIPEDEAESIASVGEAVQAINELLDKAS